MKLESSFPALLADAFNGGCTAQAPGFSLLLPIRFLLTPFNGSPPLAGDVVHHAIGVLVEDTRRDCPTNFMSQQLKSAVVPLGEMTVPGSAVLPCPFFGDNPLTFVTTPVTR